MDENSENSIETRNNQKQKRIRRRSGCIRRSIWIGSRNIWSTVGGNEGATWTWMNWKEFKFHKHFLKYKLKLIEDDKNWDGKIRLSEKKKISISQIFFSNLNLFNYFVNQRLWAREFQHSEHFHWFFISWKL